MKYLQICLVGILVLSVYGCSQNNASIINMSYGETQCADPWGTGSASSIEEVESSVVAFFENEGISFESVSVTTSTPEVTCLACDCPSFRTIHVTVEDVFKEELETYKFRED